MADHEAIKIDKANHHLLDQPLLRLPYEVLRNNFRAAHFVVEKESIAVKNALKEVATTSLSGRNSSPAGQAELLKSLDAMVARMRGVKRKLAACADEEAKIYQQVDARTAHLAELASMHTLDDVAYEQWSRRRLDRLLVDYLLRKGYGTSARALVEADEARESNNGVEGGGDDKARGAPLRDLVDLDTFARVTHIRQRLLQDHSVTEALAWCVENKKELRKMNSELEFMLRLQQYVEMVRTQEPARLHDAIVHARRYLAPLQPTPSAAAGGADGGDAGGDAGTKHGSATWRQAAALLCYEPSAVAMRYAELLSPRRWSVLADLFTTTHHQLLALPPMPLLHLALSMGLSALKTPACHSAASASATLPLGPLDAQSAAALASGTLPPVATNLVQKPYGPRPGRTNAAATAATAAALGPHNNHHPASHIGASVCPICSPELNGLARHVPYAHHTKSHVEPDLVLLPNGRVYGLARLEEYARKAGLPAGRVRDLRTGEAYPVDQLLKVYIS